MEKEKYYPFKRNSEAAVNIRNQGFEMFLKTPKPKKISISRLSVQNDANDLGIRIKKSRQNTHKTGYNSFIIHSTLNSFINSSFLNNTFNPFQASESAKEKDEKDNDKEKQESKNCMKIPRIIIERLQLDKKLNELNIIKNQINSLFENYTKSQIDLKEKKEEYLKLNQELEDAKTARDSILQETYQLKAELKKQRESIASSGSNYDSNNNVDYDKQINMYQDKIVKLKVDNQVFFEKFDNLCDEVKANEKNNKQLKNNIAEVEQHIQRLLKEKNTLKGLLDKLGN